VVVTQVLLEMHAAGDGNRHDTYTAHYFQRH
jgi:hypothetical protein